MMKSNDQKEKEKKSVSYVGGNKRYKDTLELLEEYRSTGLCMLNRKAQK